MTFFNQLAHRRSLGLILAGLLSFSCIASPGGPTASPPTLALTATPGTVTGPSRAPETPSPPPPRATFTPAITPAAPKYSYRVINSFPHDREAFTQGLAFDGGFLYESTGIFGRSSLRQVDLTTGKVLRKHDLPGNVFGEGLAVYGDTLVQLSWTTKVGFVYDKSTFELVKTFSYDHEGWGITHDGRRLIVSDGTALLRFLDPQTFVEIARVEVRDDAGPVARLNELEFIDGEIYANVWQTESIVRISPDNGRVVGKIDLTGLRNQVAGPPGEYLNGIAYDAAGDRLFVTGKLWPTLFEIELVP